MAKSSLRLKFFIVVDHKEGSGPNLLLREYLSNIIMTAKEASQRRLCIMANSEVL